MHELNENECEVLRILWDRGGLKPATIQAQFGWDIENATLRSVLRNLVDKNYVAREKLGKAFTYRARIRRGTQFGRAVQRMAEIFTAGSKADLILELLRQEKLSEEQLAALQTIANQKSSTAK